MLASLTSAQALADQRSIAQMVLLTMAHMELMDADLSTSLSGPRIASLLHYTEPSQGTILLECSPELAFRFTSRLMGIPEPTSTTDADVIDAVAELVNMIGGNLKGLMPPETSISPPIVLQQAELEAVLATAEPISRICLQSGTEQMCLSLFHQLQLQAPASSYASVA